MPLTFAERKAIHLAKAEHEISTDNLIRHIQYLLKTSDGFTLSLKTVLGESYQSLSVAGTIGRFIELDFEGKPLFVNIDQIVELTIHE